MLGTRRGVYVQLAILVALIALLVLGSHFFPIVDLFGGLQQRVIGLGAWSGVFYPLVFAACNVLLLPAGILCIGAGFFFGLWWGFFIVLLGNCIAAAISFGLGRWLGVRLIEGRKSTGQILRVLDRAVERDAWKIIFLSQLHPLFPTSLLNYLYGLTRIRFRLFMLWTTIGRAPGLFLYAYLGTLGQLGLNLARGKTHPRIVEYWTWGGAFVATALLFFVLTRAASKVMRELQNAPSQSERGSVRTQGSVI
jgi:uncharacterized membrane protein YdjX (TVP38/TMEM64 family)